MCHGTGQVKQTYWMSDLSIKWMIGGRAVHNPPGELSVGETFSLVSHKQDGSAKITCELYKDI